MVSATDPSSPLFARSQERPTRSGRRQVRRTGEVAEYHARRLHGRLQLRGEPAAHPDRLEIALASTPGVCVDTATIDLPAISVAILMPKGRDASTGAYE